MQITDNRSFSKKLHFPSRKWCAILNHNSHVENTARSYMQGRGVCVSWVHRHWEVSLKFLWWGSKSGIRSGWASVSIHPFRAEVKVMLLDLSGPWKKRCAWIPEDLFVRKAFYRLFAFHWSLLSSRKDEKEQRRQCCLVGFIWLKWVC